MRYAETDKMGVVCYANYFIWFEVGRTDLLRGAGWTYREMEAEGFSLPVIEAHCDNLKSTSYDEELEIHTSGALLSPVRIEFLYEIIRPSDTTTVATGRTVHASLDQRGRPRRLPARVKAALA